MQQLGIGCICEESHYAVAMSNSRNANRAKKSLGQHFLTSPAIAAHIAETAHLTPKDTVLEIGPGRGILTSALLARTSRVIAIEKDEALCEALRERFAKAIAENRLTLIAGDALNIAAAEQALCRSDQRRGEGSYKLVANIPYYLTGELLRAYLSAEYQPSMMVLLVQKEVAQRIVARDEKESILSISVKAYGQPRLIKIVKAGSFSPSPKVDSAILAIENISRERFASREAEERFFKILKAGFAQKRKLLKSNLAPLLPQPQAMLSACRIPDSARAENLSLTQWLCLACTTN